MRRQELIRNLDKAVFNIQEAAQNNDLAHIRRELKVIQLNAERYYFDGDIRDQVHRKYNRRIFKNLEIIKSFISSEMKTYKKRNTEMNVAAATEDAEEIALSYINLILNTA